MLWRYRQNGISPLIFSRIYPCIWDHDLWNCMRLLSMYHSLTTKNCTVGQIPQCICPVSLNKSFITELLTRVHISVTKLCVVGYLRMHCGNMRWVYWYGCRFTTAWHPQDLSSPVAFLLVHILFKFIQPERSTNSPCLAEIYLGWDYETHI